jgi:very-short-patch-repair endonuclease
MRDIADMVASLGGMAQKQQLVALGARDLDLTGSVRRNETRRARQGWYTTLPDSDPRVSAVRVGGRLTGISAIIALGGWVLARHPLHVSLRDNAARLRTPWNRHIRIKGRRIPGLVLRWDDDDVARRGSATSVDLLDALVRVVIDEEFETAVAALDWALHFGWIDWMDFDAIISRLPKRLRKIQHWVDANCESLPESLARVRIRQAGYDVVSQVWLGDQWRIDLVIAGCVGFEVDGKAYHLETFEADRSKDLDIAASHLHNIRVSANQVFNEWPRVMRAIEAAIADRSTAQL